MSDTITNLEQLCLYFGIKDSGYLAPEILEPRIARRLYDRDNGHLRMRLLRRDEQDPVGMVGIAIGDPEHSPAPSTELRYPFATATLDTLIDTMIAQGKESGPYTPPTISDSEVLMNYLGLEVPEVMTESKSEAAVEAELNKRGFTRVNFRWVWNSETPASAIGVHLGSRVEPDAQGDLLFPFNVRFMDDVLIRLQTGK